MGGIIVVDFIDMQNTEHRQKVFEKMKEAMDSDRTKHNILPLSKFGLMQITRQRVRPEMHIDTSEKCPVCKGEGEITPSILFADTLNDKIRFVVQELNKKNVTLWVHPYIYAFLKRGFPSQILKWKLDLGFGIKVKPSDSLAFLEYKFIDKDNKKVDLV
jgi:ribonuclease G